MRPYPTRACVLALLLLLPRAGHATLIHRSIDGVDLYYDSALDITWQANADLAATQTFGLPQSTVAFPSDGSIGSGGRMSWDTAIAWVDAMNAASYLGYDDWRLPTMSPIQGGSDFIDIYRNDGITAIGYNATAPGTPFAGSTANEMANLYYDTLGNLGYCSPDEIYYPNCGIQVGWGLSNTGPFTGLQAARYWFGVGVTSDATLARSFYFQDGRLDRDHKIAPRYAWAVRSGDVAHLPEPSSAWLLGAALAVIATRRRASHRRHAAARPGSRGRGAEPDPGRTGGPR